MKLKKVRVQNFRSVEDSQEFDVGGMTCLVGKNEAGKTAILQALAALRPHNGQDVEYNKTRDYPRRFLNDYGERHDGEEATVTKTVWAIDQKDQEEFEQKFGEGSLGNGLIKVSGGYEGTTYWSFDINQELIVKHLISSHKLNASEQASLKECKTTKALYKSLQEVSSPTEKQENLLKVVAGFKNQSITEEAIGSFSQKMPHFLYFSHYDRMSGQISIDALNNNKQNNVKISEEDQVFLDFLEYAGTTLEEICSTTTYEDLNSRCEAASNKITDQLMEYWLQNPYLEVVVTLTKAEPNDPAPFNTGTVARARVKNTLHRVSVPFSERSAGFIWFFSFLVKFAQVRKEFGNVIILLDEPGLTLHGKAQEDLLRYMEEKLEPNHQIIFSTHSPFMVPVNRLEDVRVVEDVIKVKEAGRPEIYGTKVSADIFANDPDTLFPLQGALGYDLAQNLFVSPNNLVVEGTSDFTYLSVISNHLREIGKNHLDERWSLVPVGGADMIPTFAALLGNHLDVTILADSQKAGHQKLMNLANKGLLEKSRILLVGDFVDKKFADIEDLFTPGDYLSLYNAAFQGNAIKVSDLNGNDQIITQINRHTGEKFDHGKPADILMRQRDKLLPKMSEKTISNFEALFEKINTTLSEQAIPNIDQPQQNVA